MVDQPMEVLPKKPFAEDVDHERGGVARLVNAEAFSKLKGWVREMTAPGAGVFTGRYVTLSAPRAGYGKSHLLRRLRREVRGECFVCGFDFDVRPLSSGSETWGAWLEAMVRDLDRQRTAGSRGPDSALDELARFLCGRYVAAGLEVGFARSDRAWELRKRALEAHRRWFDPRVPGQAMSWLLDHLSELEPVVAGRVAQTAGVDEPVLRWWTQPLVWYAAQTGRAGRLERLLGEVRRFSEGDARAAMRGLMGLAEDLRPWVLWLDHLDRFSGQVDQARPVLLRFAEIMSWNRRPVGILSCNRDLWDATLSDAVVSALGDRFRGREMALEGLDSPGAEELVRHRMRERGCEDATEKAFVAHLKGRMGEAFSEASASRSPRQVLREAARAWESWVDRGPEEVGVKPSRGETLEGVSSPASEARTRLHELAEAIRATGKLPRGGGLDAEPSKAGRVEEGASLAERFQKRRLHHAQCDSDCLNLSRLMELISVLGRRFPAIAQEADQVGRTVTWHTHRQTIGMGFAEPDSTEFWEGLAQRMKETQVEEAPDGMRGFKLVRFRRAWHADARERGTEVSPGTGGVALETLVLDRELQVNLAAAADFLIGEMDEPGSASRQAELFGFIARELDFFWRRLTRPVASAEEAVPSMLES